VQVKKRLNAHAFANHGHKKHSKRLVRVFGLEERLPTPKPVIYRLFLVAIDGLSLHVCFVAHLVNEFATFVILRLLQPFGRLGLGVVLLLACKAECALSWIAVSVSKYNLSH